MARPGKCQHDWKVMESTTTLVLWSCDQCHAGPYWSIYECIYCKYHVCGTCKRKVMRA
ncbi:hypothetical protein K470DRAFT_299132 [Piedraia hortae CBS 480.64]|uniref:Phorbol-ester/DAG-type domain-containing protein n=1 Tax=Piedraia hortae CBS 480.64 TaxID=1314780 RepID=A0A6A7C4L9_9PEZI|nr:hypothetical protein K470DRAFT_299132 [Piedraia hortae CBS 480.64]